MSFYYEIVPNVPQNWRFLHFLRAMIQRCRTLLPRSVIFSVIFQRMLLELLPAGNERSLTEVCAVSRIKKMFKESMKH